MITFNILTIDIKPYACLEKPKVIRRSTDFVNTVWIGIILEERVI